MRVWGNHLQNVQRIIRQQYQRVMMVVVWMLLSVGVHAQDRVLAAQEAFSRSDYAAVVSEYEALLSEGPVADARVYANLGAAYARLQKKGEAVWAYALALRLDPRDAQLAADAAFVSGTQETIVPWRVRAWRGDWPILSGLTATEIVVVGVGCYGVFWILGIVFLWRGGVRLRRTWIVVGLVMLGWSALGGPRVFSQWGQMRAIVVGDTQPVYSSFVGDSERFKVEPGTEIRILNADAFSAQSSTQHEHWMSIALDDGRSGWIKDPQVRPLPQTD